MRFRKIDNHYYRTIKSGQGLVRQEIQEQITKADFYALMDQKDNSTIIEKYRYTFSYKGHTYEMDAFKRHLEGLLYLEIEFDSLQRAQNFKLPKRLKKIVLDEVTNNVAFSNRSLALEGLPVFDTPLEELTSKIKAKTPLSAALQLQFHPFDNIYAVLKVWVSKLTDTIEANKMAIIKGDVDSERLHQLRVALRKLRSVLTLLAKHLQITEAKELAKLAKEVMRNTNEARDLDVYIEWLDQYENQNSPDSLSQSLTSIKKRLEQKRQSAYEKLKNVLQNDEYTTLLHMLHQFSQTKPSQKYPAILLGKKLILQLSQKIVKKAQILTKKSKPHKYHLVRIEIKKLRYMLEFFSPIFDQKKFEKIITRIKRFQDILGYHQDTMVQIEYIEHLKQEELCLEDQKALRFISASLEHRAKKLRKKFRNRIPTIPLIHHQLKSTLCRV